MGALVMRQAEEQALFYHEMGFTIAEWVSVEKALFGVLACCAGNDHDVQMLAHGLFTIENFRSRLAFVDACMTNRFYGTPQYTDWPKLNTRVGRASQKRNKIVHNLVFYLPNYPHGRRYALEPWFNDPTKKQPKPGKHPDGSLTLRDIAAIRMEFHSLFAALGNYRARILGQQEPHPKALEQPPRPPTIPELRDRIRAELGHPLPPSKRKGGKPPTQAPEAPISY